MSTLDLLLPLELDTTSTKSTLGSLLTHTSSSKTAVTPSWKEMKSAMEELAVPLTACHS